MIFAFSIYPMSNFQIAILAIFIVFFVGAILIFSGILPIGQSSPNGAAGQVVLWGTVPVQNLSQILGAFNQANKTFSVSYVQKDPATYDKNLLEAFASGTGPDIFFLPDDLILKYTNKILLIPYTTLPQKTFTDTFVGESNLYMTDGGVLAFPLMIDPMVMYYNTSLFDAAGIPKVPQYWDEFLSTAQDLTSKDNAGNIVKSAISFGEFDNILHAKDIIATLIMQAGNPIVAIQNNALSSVMRQSAPGSPTVPAAEALRFYTQFSNPLQADYSWNKSMPNSRDAFIAGRLAVYFGYASELFTLRDRNPNLSFDVAQMPQTRNAQAKLTFGKMNGLAISKTSKNVTTAATIAALLAGKDMSQKITAALNLPPVRRDLLAVKPTTSYGPVFYDGALIARAWLDPDTNSTTSSFGEMVNSIVSGASNEGLALQKASDEIDLSLRSL